MWPQRVGLDGRERVKHLESGIFEFRQQGWVLALEARPEVGVGPKIRDGVPLATGLSGGTKDNELGGPSSPFLCTWEYSLLVLTPLSPHPAQGRLC